MILSISGEVGAGKDTCADYLVQHHGYIKLSFASTIKDVLSIIFSWDRVLLEGSTPASRQWREQVDTWWAHRLNIPELSPRWAMKHISTELFRQQFNEEIWILALENKIRQYCTNKIVINDCRFFNEYDMLDKMGAKFMQVYKTVGNHVPLPSRQSVHEFYAGSGIHESVYSSWYFKYHHLVKNDSTLNVLYQRLDAVL